MNNSNLYVLSDIIHKVFKAYGINMNAVLTLNLYNQLTQLFYF